MQHYFLPSILYARAVGPICRISRMANWLMETPFVPSAQGANELVAYLPRALDVIAGAVWNYSFPKEKFTITGLPVGSFLFGRCVSAVYEYTSQTIQREIERALNAMLK